MLRIAVRDAMMHVKAKHAQVHFIGGFLLLLQVFTIKKTRPEA